MKNETHYVDLSCREFAERLASKDAVPGGGGVSALVAALAAALSNMVGSLTVGKKKYASVEEELLGLMAKLEVLRTELLELVEEDARSFEPLSKAYGLPKDTEEEKAYKQEVMEKCLHDAAQVPLEIMRKTAEIVPMAQTFAEKGSVIAVSDAGVSAALCSAALRSAALNVYINTGMMKDREYAKRLDAECEELIEEFCPMADQVYADVSRHLQEKGK